MESEKDALLDIAIENILAIIIEGQYVNKDYLGYWSLLKNKVMSSSISSFSESLQDFYSGIYNNENRKDLANYNFRILTRLVNNECVYLAASNLYETFKIVALEKQGIEFNFDLLHKDKEFYDLTKFEKVLFLMYMYQDKLDTQFISVAPIAEKTSKKAKFRERFNTI